MRTSFACDFETMERLAEYERDYQERYSLPVDSARKGALRREHENRRTAKRIAPMFTDMLDLSIISVTKQCAGILIVTWLTPLLQH